MSCAIAVSSPAPKPSHISPCNIRNIDCRVQPSLGLLFLCGRRVDGREDRRLRALPLHLDLARDSFLLAHCADCDACGSVL